MTTPRQQKLLSFLQAHGEANVEVLVKELDASEATVRRDLAKLETDGLLIRTFGGARLKDSSSLTVNLLREKREIMSEEKRQIALKAAQMVEPGMSVALDSGSTTWFLSRVLRNKAPLDIVTNSMSVVEELGAVEGIHIYLVGGRFNPKNLDLLGSEAVEAFGRLRVNLAFLGIDSFIPGRGVFANTQDDANLLGAMARCSERCVVVADHSKFNAKGLFLGVANRQIHGFVTDAGLDPEIRQRLEQSEPFKLILAGETSTGNAENIFSKGAVCPDCVDVAVREPRPPLSALK
ncbi:MAG: DeoR/GlpR family DNA-binding transcription regulator [Verrucomicrobiae bacterium]|nr:DeoR/GlpR family DNA-binding transcription regulator [Verrucomicrobiae bacterium]